MRIIPSLRLLPIVMPVLALLVPVDAAAAPSGHAFEFLRLASDPVGRSLSGAHIASVSGPCAIAWNPAGLAAEEPGALLLSHTAWMGETSWDWGGISVPAGGGGLAFSCALFRAGELPGYDENGTPSGDFSPTQAAVAAGYGHPLCANLDAGAALEWGLESDGRDVSHSGFACSAGARFHSGPFGLAAAVRHLGPAIGSGEDRFAWPRTITAGASLETGFGLALHAALEQTAGEAANLAAGCAWQATEGLCFLGGLRASAESEEGGTAPSAGLLFDLGRASFAYGYQTHADLAGAHQVALSLRFR